MTFLLAARQGFRFPKIQQMLVGIAIEQWLRYAIFAGIAWLLAYVFFKKRWWRRKIIQRDPLPSDLRREFLWSLSTVVIYALVGTGTLLLGRPGWLKIYKNIGDYGWLWFFASIVVAIFIHDAYFYWTHRLMHHRKLFRLFHKVHHQSTNPSPWASYSFAPLEAVVQAGIFPLLVLTMPMHPIAFLVFMIWQITFNVAGHTGYEFYPRWMLQTWFGKFINTPTNHIQHHEKMRGNYGLYFNLWDRLLGTNHKDYEARFQEVTTRPHPHTPA
ncbi:sterol desaturase family protein [Brevifollis gellanilyticus]|uniref:Sterol desaturase n=1 Tax=Brevifollis gellanilyticus TaxID=748831 RepID=A0A512MBF6_9BACT|nr:sterol desaturase family protein [Brevifollis gellanilyticus]GEP44063.1 sterol desaturase [Brevifollis gellanilyticus]